MSIFGLGKVADMVVRPIRQTYRKNDLERISLNIKGKKHYRKDFTITIPTDQYLECSIFSEHPEDPIRHLERCMIYLHCNTGCKIEGLSYVNALLGEDIPVLVFDFRGSGMSSGEYISMGLTESQDVGVVIDYILNINPEVKIGLWGRSMGAAAALHYCARNLSLSVAVLDSPFLSLEQMIVNIGKKKTILPGVLVSFLFKFVNPYLYEKAGLNIQDVNNLSVMKDIRTPLIFVTSITDNVVPTRDVQFLYQSYAGQKQILYINKQHNQRRDPSTVEQIVSLVKPYLRGDSRTSRLVYSLKLRKNVHEKESLKDIKRLRNRQYIIPQ